MKKSKKILAVLLSACVVCALPAVISGCAPDDGGTSSTQGKDPVKIKDGAVTVKAGESKILTVSEYVTANGKTVTVESTNKSVATATYSEGKVTVTAEAEGTANVKIMCGDVVATIAVTVEAKEIDPPAVTFGDITGSLNLSKAEYVDITLAPESGGDGLTFTYEITTPVDGAVISGNVLRYTPASAVNAEISVTAKITGAEGEYNFKVKITVTDGSEVVRHTVTVDGVATEVEDGEEFTLPSYTGTPDEGKEFSKWKIGETYYNVGDKIAVTGNLTVTSVFVNKKYTVTLEGAEAEYEHGAQITLSADKYTAAVPSGKILAGWLVNGEKKSVGTTITVTGALTITAVIENEPETSPVKIKDGEAKSLYLDDETITIDVSEYITANGNPVSVSSSAENVASVGESGGTVTVTAVGAGKTDVKITCKNIEITFAVTVKNAAPVFENKQIEIDKAESLEGSVNVSYTGADTFTYEYSCAGVAVKDGVLTYTADSGLTVGAHEVTVNVTATDEATGAVENASFKLTVNVSDTTAYRVKNGGFEGEKDSDGNPLGSLDGWTYAVAEGSTDFGRLTNEDYYWKNPDKDFNKEGKWLFTGIETKDPHQETGTGTLKSENFMLKQNGWITFRLGGAHNALCGVRVRSSADNSILAEFNNVGRGVEGTMDKYKFKFSGMTGDMQCYIEVFDEAEGGWGLVVVDDFNTYYKEEPTNAVLITPALYNLGVTSKIKNGGFEDGSYGWRVVTESGDGEFGFISTNASATWGDESNVNSYKNEGYFFQNGNEGATGYLLSSVFEVSEQGWISFKLGGNKTAGYVAIVDAATGEELVKYVNGNFVGGWPTKGWEMYGYKANLIADGIAAGRKVQIKVVDNSTGDYGVVICDSFITDYTAEPEKDGLNVAFSEAVKKTD